MAEEPSILNELSDTPYGVRTSRVSNQTYHGTVRFVFLADEAVNLLDILTDAWRNLT